jgi:hypothetical protein
MFLLMGNLVQRECLMKALEHLVAAAGQAAGLRYAA